MPNDKKTDAKPVEKSKLNQILDNADQWLAKTQYDAAIWEEKNIPGMQKLAEFEEKHASFMLSNAAEKAIHDVHAEQAKHPAKKTEKPAEKKYNAFEQAIYNVNYYVDTHMQWNQKAAEWCIDHGFPVPQAAKDAVHDAGAHNAHHVDHDSVKAPTAGKKPTAPKTK